MICYFWGSLKPSIKIEIEQQNRESMNFEKIVQKTVNVETKVGLKSSIMVRDSYICCTRGHRPSHNTSSKVQTQGSNYKNLLCSKESKSKDPKSASPYDNTAELA